MNGGFEKSCESLMIPLRIKDSGQWRIDHDPGVEQTLAGKRKSWMG